MAPALDQQAVDIAFVRTGTNGVLSVPAAADRLSPGSASCRVPSTDPPRFTRAQVAAVVEPIAERAIRDQGLVGLSVGVAHRGEPLYLAGFGMADRERQRSASGDTQYDVGSIAKRFTAVAVLQLAERGLLQLDDRVSQHLPDHHGPMRDATIRALLTHTSGFMGPDIDESVRQPELEEAQSTAQLLALPAITEARRIFASGSSFSYSNAGFQMLRVLVETVAGHSYGVVMEEQILGPAGMTGSVAAKWAEGPHVAATYMWQGDELQRPPPLHPSVFPSIITSVRDLLAFQCALDAGLLLKQASLALMNDPAVVEGQHTTARIPYGLGTRLSPAHGHDRVGHTGTWPGGTAAQFRYPADDLVVAVATNTGGAPAVHAATLESMIGRALLGDVRPASARTALPIDSVTAAQVVGRYQFNTDQDLVWEEGRLVWRDSAGAVVGHYLRVGPRAFHYIAGADAPPSEIPDRLLTRTPEEFVMDGPKAGWIVVHNGFGALSQVARRIDPQPE